MTNRIISALEYAALIFVVFDVVTKDHFGAVLVATSGFLGYFFSDSILDWLKSRIGGA